VKSDERYERFIADVCEALQVDVDDVRGRCREAGVVMLTRFLLVYLLRKTYKLSYPKLGRLMKRDHSTCRHHDREFARRLERGDEDAMWAMGRIAGVGEPLAALERPLDSLRYCGVDDGVAIELATEAVD
jgi:hypothetical protein